MDDAVESYFTKLALRGLSAAAPGVLQQSDQQ
jgi:hypothetical protein